jgi:hypothetical protein
VTENRYSPPASVVADPGSAGPPPPMPPAVKLAIRFMWATLALSVLSTALMWFESPTLGDSAIERVIYVVAILLSFGITLVLILFIKHGANWARVVNLVIFLVGAASLAFLGANDAAELPQSPTFRILEILSWAISIAALAMLYFPAANLWFREMREYRRRR